MHKGSINVLVPHVKSGVVCDTGFSLQVCCNPTQQISIIKFSAEGNEFCTLSVVTQVTKSRLHCAFTKIFLAFETERQTISTGEKCRGLALLWLQKIEISKTTILLIPNY